MPPEEMTEEEFERHFLTPRSEKPELLDAFATPDGLMVPLTEQAVEEFETAVGERDADPKPEV
jgi:hypothetical protein